MSPRQVRRASTTASRATVHPCSELSANYVERFLDTVVLDNVAAQLGAIDEAHLVELSRHVITRYLHCWRLYSLFLADQLPRYHDKRDVDVQRINADAESRILPLREAVCASVLQLFDTNRVESERAARLSGTASEVVEPDASNDLPEEEVGTGKMRFKRSLIRRFAKVALADALGRLQESLNAALRRRDDNFRQQMREFLSERLVAR